MHVLVADPMTAETRAGLEGLGVMLTYVPDIEPHALADRAKRRGMRSSSAMKTEPKLPVLSGDESSL